MKVQNYAKLIDNLTCYNIVLCLFIIYPTFLKPFMFFFNFLIYVTLIEFINVFLLIHSLHQKSHGIINNSLIQSLSKNKNIKFINLDYWRLTEVTIHVSGLCLRLVRHLIKGEIKNINSNTT